MTSWIEDQKPYFLVKEVYPFTPSQTWDYRILGLDVQEILWNKQFKRWNLTLKHRPSRKFLYQWIYSCHKIHKNLLVQSEDPTVPQWIQISCPHTKSNY